MRPSTLSAIATVVRCCACGCRENEGGASQEDTGHGSRVRGGAAAGVGCALGSRVVEASSLEKER